MPYIKISDPNIIDLAAWHQVINVINQHSDSITAITNNFGAQGTGTTDWNGATDIAHEYDPGSQKIVYGKFKLDTTTASSTTGDHMYYATIDMVQEASGTTAFSARPIITASATFGSQTVTPPTTTNSNVVCTIMAVNEDRFTVRLTNARSTVDAPIPLTGYFYVSWMAIGPK